MIVSYSITVFIVQLVFIGCRTWNVRAIAAKNILGVLVSGAFVHISWLISIAIGSLSMYEILANWNWDYIPVIICSLVGGLLGSYIAMKLKN